jgi:hypothetical protein
VRVVGWGALARRVGAHEGIPALVCQEMSRAGVQVTAVISGGDGAFAQNACMEHGARGVFVPPGLSILFAASYTFWPP